jgi:ATP-binding cassette subfamily F protein uup
MVGGQPRHVVGYMRDFLFLPEQRHTPLEALSGGERGRVMLARALAKASNVLVLDEPTNDLDLETLDVLEEMLDDYAGTVLVVSHDRDFLDRVVSFVIVPEGDGRWQEYAGGYSDMLVQRGADLRRAPVKTAAKAADKPAKAPPSAPSERKRLTFKDKHALETLPKTIATLQAEISKLTAQLADPELYARDRKRFDQTSSALADAQQKLAEAEERWLALEILREEIEGR